MGDPASSDRRSDSPATDRPNANGQEHAQPAVPPLDEAKTLPPDEGCPSFVNECGPDRVPEVPGYEILGELGRGGMGVVYKARQIALGRVVALKMILSGGHAAPTELARFRSEAEAVARLHHPNIIQIYEIDEHEGRPYFSLEYAEGGNLSSKLCGTPAPARHAARFVETLARAVEAAHRAGIVHRDLKPGNVLLVPASGSASSAVLSTQGQLPDLDLREWVPKITDFGLAKRLAHEGAKDCLTHAGTILGTPSYMSPEQASSREDLVGPATDVYALGAILYELLTGRPPFKAATPMDTVLQVMSQEPVAPTRLQPKIPRDLNTICLKCLEKNPRKRYARAEELADELHRFLEHKPIHARPTPFWERGWKWARRRPATAIVSGLAAALFVGAGAVRVWLWAEKAGQLPLAIAQREEDTRNAYLKEVALAARAWSQSDPDQAQQCLEACPQALRSWEWHYLDRLCHGGLLTIQQSGGAQAAWYPDGVHVAVADVDHQTVTVWDTHSGQSVFSLAEAGPGLALSGDGHWLAVGRWSNGRSSTGGEAGGMRVVDARTGKDKRSWPVPRTPVWGVAFSPDGRRLAYVGTDAAVHVMEAETGRLVRTFERQTGPVGSVRFSPDGLKLAQVDGTGLVRVWDVETGRAVLTVPPPPLEPVRPPIEATEAANGRLRPRLLTRWLRPLAISPDGAYLATGAGDAIIVHDLQSGRQARVLQGHAATVRSLAFSPDGRRIASGAGDRTVKIWDFAGGGPPITYRGHSEPVNAVAFSPDGALLLSAGLDRIRIWRTNEPPEASIIRLPSSAGRPAFSLDGERIASPMGDSVVVWDRTGHELQRMRGSGAPVLCAAFGAQGTVLASGSADGTARVWDPGSGRLLHTFHGHRGGVTVVAFNAEGNRLASAGVDRAVQLWDLESGAQLQVLQALPEAIVSLAFRPDTSTVAMGCANGQLVLWNPTGSGAVRLNGHLDDVESVVFSPKGRHLASASLDGTVRLWDVELAQEIHVFRGHPDGAWTVAFGSEGTRLASGGEGGLIKLWEPLAGQEILTLSGHQAAVRSLRFAGDGRLLLSGDTSGLCRVWNATPQEESTTAAERAGPGQRVLPERD